MWWLPPTTFWPWVTHIEPVKNFINFFLCSGKCLVTVLSTLQFARVWWYLRKILGAARNQLGLVVYYLTAEIARCIYFIFRANFRGACSPASSFKFKSCDGWIDICGMKFYWALSSYLDLCDCILKVAADASTEGRDSRVPIPALPRASRPWLHSSPLPPSPSPTSCLCFPTSKSAWPCLWRSGLRPLC